LTAAAEKNDNASRVTDIDNVFGPYSFTLSIHAIFWFVPLPLANLRIVDLCSVPLVPGICDAVSKVDRATCLGIPMAHRSVAFAAVSEGGSVRRLPSDASTHRLQMIESVPVDNVTSS
jgi:hypothetical protein